MLDVLAIKSETIKTPEKQNKTEFTNNFGQAFSPRRKYCYI